MRKLIFGLLLIFSACSVQNERYFSNFENATDSDYGFTIENPILIKNGNLKNSLKSADYFLSKLEMKDGKSLEISEQKSYPNPNGENQLFAYTLKTQEPQPTTLQIFINPYEKGEIKIPKGVRWGGS